MRWYRRLQPRTRMALLAMAGQMANESRGLASAGSWLSSSDMPWENLVPEQRAHVALAYLQMREDLQLADLPEPTP